MEWDRDALRRGVRLRGTARHGRMRTRSLRTSAANLVLCALCCGSACVAGTARADPVAPTPPPNEAPAVPNPGPEIIAGTPGSPDRLPLTWDWAPFSTADYVITGAAG